MFFFDKNIESLEIIPNSIEEAYFLLLENRLQEAQNIFEKFDSPRGYWGYSLTEILLGRIPCSMTYLEVSNFLEIDLDFFIKNQRYDYVETILNNVDFFIRANHSTCRYIARVFYANKLYDTAKLYLDRSKDIFFNDPEMHFIYAKYYIRIQRYDLAYSHLEECLKIIPGYYPAVSMQKEISQYLV